MSALLKRSAECAAVRKPCTRIVAFRVGLTCKEKAAIPSPSCFWQDREDPCEGLACASVLSTCPQMASSYSPCTTPCFGFVRRERGVCLSHPKMVQTDTLYMLLESEKTFCPADSACFGGSGVERSLARHKVDAARCHGPVKAICPYRYGLRNEPDPRLGINKGEGGQGATCLAGCQIPHRTTTHDPEYGARQN